MSTRILNFWSLVGYAILVIGVGGLWIVHALFSTNPIIILIQSLAVLLFLWARITFGIRSFHAAAAPTDGGLVTAGPYHHIRHPIYASVVLFTWAGAAWNLDWVPLILALTVLVGVLIRIACEERLLVERYPQYREYAQRTQRMIPFLF